MTDSAEPMATEPVDDTQLMCPACGYNLSGITRDVCPECGERFVLAPASIFEIAHDDPEARSTMGQIATVVLIAGVVVLMFSFNGNGPPYLPWVGAGLIGLAYVLGSGILPSRSRSHDDYVHDAEAHAINDNESDDDAMVFSVWIFREHVRHAARTYLWREHGWWLVFVPLSVVASVGLYIGLPNPPALLLFIAGFACCWTYLVYGVVPRMVNQFDATGGCRQVRYRLTAAGFDAETKDRVIHAAWSSQCLWRTARCWFLVDQRANTHYILPTDQLPSEVERFILKQLTAHGGTIE